MKIRAIDGLPSHAIEETQNRAAQKAHDGPPHTNPPPRGGSTAGPRPVRKQHMPPNNPSTFPIDHLRPGVNRGVLHLYLRVPPSLGPVQGRRGRGRAPERLLHRGLGRLGGGRLYEGRLVEDVVFLCHQRARRVPCRRRGGPAHTAGARAGRAPPDVRQSGGPPEDAPVRVGDGR